MKDDTDFTLPVGEAETAVPAPAPEAPAPEAPEPAPEPQTQQPPVQDAEGQEQAQEPSEDQKKPRRDRTAEARIGFLTARAHQLEQQVAEMQRRLQLSQETELTASEGHLTAELDRAKNEYRNARAEGDLDKEALAVERVAAVQARLHEVQRDKLQFAPQPEARQHAQQPPPQPQQPFVPRSQVDDDWARDNSDWFNIDPTRTQLALQAQAMATQQGFRVGSKEAYDYIDRVQRAYYPHSYETAPPPQPQPRQQAQPQQPQPQQPLRAGGVTQPAMYRAQTAAPPTQQPRKPAPTNTDLQFCRNLNMTWDELLEERARGAS